MEQTTLCQAHRLLRTTREMYHGYLQQYISANSELQEALAQYKMFHCKQVIAELVGIINSYEPPTPMPAPVEAFFHQTAALASH